MQEYSAGIGVLAAKAGLLTAKGADAAGGGDGTPGRGDAGVVVTAGAEAVGFDDVSFARCSLPPQAVRQNISASVAANSLMGYIYALTNTVQRN